MLERETVLEALRACNGNRSKSGAMLGVSHTAIGRAVARYNITRAEIAAATVDGPLQVEGEYHGIAVRTGNPNAEPLPEGFIEPDYFGAFAFAVAHNIPTWLEGPAGAGKTSLVHYLAARTGNTLYTQNAALDLASADLRGNMHLVGGETVFRYGALAEAMRSGGWYLLDEIRKARPDVLSVIHKVTDNGRALYIPETGETVHAHRNFRFFAACNPVHYSGNKDMDAAFLSRFVIFHAGYLPADKESAVLQASAPVDAETARKMLDVAAKTREARKGLECEFDLTLRQLIHWGVMTQFYGNPVQAFESAVRTQAQSETDAHMLDRLVELIFGDDFSAAEPTMEGAEA